MVVLEVMQILRRTSGITASTNASTTNNGNKRPPLPPLLLHHYDAACQSMLVSLRENERQGERLN